MRTTTFTVIIISVMLMFSLKSSAKNYYVSLQGNDNQSGTAEQPFKTIRKASISAVAGDVIYIYGGIYEETINAVRSGTSSKPIRFMAMAGEDVVIKGTQLVSNWTATETPGMYVADVNMTLGDYNHVFINGYAMTLARWPNDKDNDPFTIDAIVQEAGDNTMVQHKDIPDVDWTGGMLWYLGKHGGCSLREPITAFDAATNQIKFATMPESWPYSNHSPALGGQFYLTNVFGALDAPNEWYYDRTNKKLYIIAPDRIDPNNCVVECRKYRQAIHTKGFNYIEFDGINVFGAQVRLEGSYNVFRNGQVRHADYGLGNQRGSNTSLAAVAIKGKYNTVENSLIEWGWGNGINCEWTTAELTVKNCIIRYFDMAGSHDAALRMSGTGSKALYNTISHSGRDVIKHSGQHQEYAYNDVSKGSLINVDAGLFYTAGNNGDGNKLHHNWFHDSHGPDFDPSGKACAIYLDNSTKRYAVHHNVVWNIEWTGVQMNWDDWYLYIYNNTFWNTSSATGAWHKEGTEFKEVVFGNNYSNTGYWDCTDTFTNIINKNNPFENFSERHFMPAEGSMLLDAGTIIPDYTTNVTDGKPDIGAYERGEDYWVPGVDWSPRQIMWLSEPEDGVERPYHTLAVKIPATIEAEHYNIGGEGLAYHDLTAENTGRSFRTNDGVDIVKDDEVYSVIDFEAGEWLNYFITIEDTTAFVFRADVLSEAGCTFQLEADGKALGDPILIEAGNSDGIRVKHVFVIDSGRHNIRIKVSAGSMAMDKFSIENYYYPSIAFTELADSLFISEKIAVDVDFSTGEKGFVRLSVFNSLNQQIAEDSMLVVPGKGIAELKVLFDKLPTANEQCTLLATLHFLNESGVKARVEKECKMMLKQHLENNDFELGNLNGWRNYRAFIEPGLDVINGSYSAQLRSGGMLWQDVRLAANTSYLVRIKCKVAEEGQKGFIAVENSEEEIQKEINNTDVQTVTLRFKTGDESKLLKFIIKTESGTTLWVDDVELLMDLSSDVKKTEYKIAVYPNPTSEWINLLYHKTLQSVNIYDMKGVLVKQVVPVDNRIDIHNLQSGIYVGFTQLQNGNIYRFRFVKQ